ncbi:Phospholipase C and C2 calcium-dependent membrane targeting domain containing protein [Aphelenchoides fujianensis]|nr:Phospholipase C and C2 calcium-dependent membrane targeting domain containing protein [Aphelenchoides fujianensis]
MSNNHPLNLRNATLRSSLRKQHGRQKSPGRKTVQFCSQNTEKKVSNVADCLQIMQNGSEMVKLRTNVRQFCRVFTLDADLSYIRWTPTNKKPHKARISVDSIKEDECAFSIIYGATYECLDLIALTPDDANIWVTGLMALTSAQRPDFQPVERTMATIRERWLGSVFDEADKDKKGYISEKTTVRTICEINPRLLLSRVKLKVKEASVIGNVDNNRGHIEREQFVEIYKDISTRPEVYFLMVRYANKDYLSCDDLQVFLETEQGMIGVDRSFCQELIEEYEPSPEAKQKHCMTVDGFTSYLLSKSGLVFDPSHYAVCHDMDRPFNEYFIAASYNTYLVEDQTNGPCSIDGYVTALKRNCRFIELNVWDPLDELDPQEPVICRSSTAVSKISFSAVLQTIRDLAFEKTKYPLFVRLDVHLSTGWQTKACDLLVNILGDKLYQPKQDTIDWSDPANVPDAHPLPRQDHPRCYRHIPLLNNEGEPLDNCTLFVHVAITNRRGGGKPKKRGMSVKRKMNRVQTGMKLIEVKATDDLFKSAAVPLVESIEMRNHLEGALTEWQEQCGIGPTGSMRQGLRLLHSRISNAAAEASPTTPTMQTAEAMPFWVEQVEQDGALNMPSVIEKLSEASNKITDYYVDFPQLCEEMGLRGQKAQRAAENFAWNVRLLKAQFTLACKTQSEAKDMIQQVIETAKSLGVFRSPDVGTKV